MDQFGVREAGGGWKKVQNKGGGRREASMLDKGGKIVENVGKGGGRSLSFG